MIAQYVSRSLPIGGFVFYPPANILKTNYLFKSYVNMSHALYQLGGFIFDSKVQKRSPPNANILKTNHLFKA